jgi:hypothetical protein
MNIMDTRVGDGLIEDVRRRGECDHKIAGEHRSEQRDDCGKQQRDTQRRAGGRLGLVEVVGAERLPDQDGSAGAEPHHQRNEGEHDGEEHAHCGERVDADHLAEIDVVDGAEQRLQDVARHHRQEEKEKAFPERRRVGQGEAGHGHAFTMGAAHRAARRCRFSWFGSLEKRSR